MKWREKWMCLACVFVMTLVAAGFPLAGADGDVNPPFTECIDKKLKCDPGQDDCANKRPCYYGACNDDGECQCDRCYGGPSCLEKIPGPDCFNAGDMKNSGGVKHRAKRAAVPVPEKMQFTLTKTPDALQNLKVGQRIDFTLVVRVGAGADQKLLIEIFTPNNDTTIMMLYDVRIDSVGADITNREQILKTEIKLEGKTNAPFPYDRAILDFGTMIGTTHATGASVEETNIEIKILFSAAMYVTEGVSATDDQWVSVGAEFDGSNSIWVGQASFKADNTAATLSGSGTPTFNIDTSACNNPKLGIPCEIKLKMNLNDQVNDPLSIDVIAPLQTTSIMSACAVLVSKDQKDYENYKCLSQTMFQPVGYKDTDGYANGRTRLELGRVVNTGITSAGVRPDITQAANTIELSIYMMFVDSPIGKAVAGQPQKAGMAVELGTDKIWAGEFTVTPAAKQTTFNDAVTPTVKMKDVDTTTAYSAGSIVTFDLVFTVPTESNKANPGTYKVEALMPLGADNKAQLGICRMEIVYHGWNVPCVVPPNEPVFSKTDPAGLNDRGVWELGPIVNMNGVVDVTNSTANEVHVRVYASVYNQVPDGTDLGITVGLYVGTTKLWVGMSGNITTQAAVAQNAAAAVENAPTFGLNYTFDDGTIPFGAVTDIQLSIQTKRSKEYGMMDLEIMMPNTNGKPTLKMCKAEAIFGGRNLPCFDKDVANAQIEYRNRSEIQDRAILKIGQTCNVGSYNSDIEDKIIIRALIKVISETPTPSAYSAGVMYSSTTIWVGQTSLNVAGQDTAKFNVTHPSQLNMFVATADNDTETEEGLPDSFIVRFKLPPQSRSLYKLTVTKTSGDGIVCDIQYGRSGDNYQCEDFEEEDRLPDVLVAQDKSFAVLDAGVITNPYFDAQTVGEVYDNTSIEFNAFVTTKVGVTVYQAKLEYREDADVWGEKTVDITLTGKALTAYTTPSASKPTITVINSKWNAIEAQANNDVIKSQAVRFIYTAVIKAGSRNKMKAIVSTTVAGAIKFTNIGLESAGKTLACIIPPDDNYVITNDGATIEADFGVVKPLAIPEANDTDRTLQVEVVARVLLSTTHSGAIPVKFRTEYDTLSESDESTTNLNLLTTDDYTDVDSTANVTLTWDNVPSPHEVKPGEVYSMNVTATVPAQSSTKATLDCEAPYVDGTKHAKATVESLTVVKSGRNLAGMDVDTYTATHTSKNGIQNSRGVIELGVVTNTGFMKRIHNITDPEDDQFLATCTYRVADEDSMQDASTFPMSVGLKLGAYIVITDMTDTVKRDNNEKPKYTLNATVIDPPAGGKFTRGDEIHAELFFAHTWDSKAEGKNTQLLIFVPKYMEYVTTAGTTTNTSGRIPDDLPTEASPATNYIKFKWDRFLFAENTTLRLKLRIKTEDAHLPSGMTDDHIAIPVDFGSEMALRTGNADSGPGKFHPTDEMAFIEFDVHQIPPPSKVGGATCTETVLGLEDGTIKDCQISSSVESLNEPQKVRKGASGWSPFVRGGKLKEGRYIQIYLGTQLHAVYKAEIIARSSCKVTRVKSRFSNDGGSWTWGDQVDLVWGASDATKMVAVNSPPLNYFRLYLLADNCALGDPVILEMELKGCNTADTPQAMVCPPTNGVFQKETPSEEATYRSMVSTTTGMIFCDVLKFSTAGKERQCIRHSKDGTTFKFTRLPKVVVGMLGYDTLSNELYAMARDDRSYMISADTGRTWFTIPKSRWTQVSQLATTKKAVNVPWQSKTQLMNGNDPRYVVDDTYGADFHGIKYKSGGAWSTIVDWSTY